MGETSESQFTGLTYLVFISFANANICLLYTSDAADE